MGETVFLKNVINETGAIHAAVRRIGRAISVAEIFSCQRKSGIEDLANFERISCRIRNLRRGKGSRSASPFFLDQLRLFPPDLQMESLLATGISAWG